MGFIIMIIVGGLIGWIAGMIMGKDIPGPVWGGVPIFPALIGAIILIFIVSLILKAIKK